jgi:hypothetical protein
LENGYAVSSFQGLISKFIKQTIDTNILKVLEDIYILRKNSDYVVIENVEVTSIEEELLTELLNNISAVKEPYNYFNARNVLLESLCPPSGYSLLLIMLASNLLNRAYIVSYNNRFTNTNIFETDSYKRVLSLLGYCGILLIKTSLPHVQSLGINILKTFRIYITDIDPTNLLDL